jgi:hypothetical protein
MMLIDKGVTPGEVVTLRLVSAEEVVCKLVEENENSYKISRPMTITVTNQGIGMLPFVFTTPPDKNLNINKSAVVMISPTELNFADQYISGTTGIDLK